MRRAPAEDRKVVQRTRQLVEHRGDLRLDVRRDGGLDAQTMVQQDRADFASDHVRVVVGEANLLAQRRLGLIRQRRQRRDVGVGLLRETRDREEEGRTGRRLGVQGQALELGIEPFRGR